MDIAPSQTIYVNNLNDRIPKDELRRSLYSLFTQFGAVLDVVALKTARMRGQAFIAFRDIGNATTALRTMQGFVFLGKPMRLTYAKVKSHAVMKEEGTFHKLSAAKKIENAKARAAEQAAPAATTGVPDEDGAIPNLILFFENLPADATGQTIALLCQQFPGLKDVRMVPMRPDIAFVEFDNVERASVAKSSLNGFQIAPGVSLSVTYANK